MRQSNTKTKLLPNFIIFGAEKSGTTSLYHYLKQHPEIYMSPEKEPYFFICENGYPEVLGNRIELDNFLKTRIKTMDEYEKLFSGVKNEKAIGEASANYIYVSKAAEKIKHYIPEVKLICVLRNPVDRAYSNFLHCIGRGVEPLRDFSEALKQEEKRIHENWGLVHYYKEKGFYYKYLKKYFELFKKDQIKVYIYNNFKDFPEQTVKDIFSFLNVDSSFVPETSRQHNVSKTLGLKKNIFTSILQSRNPLKIYLKDLIPKNLKNKIITSMNKHNVEPIKPMNQEIREMLLNAYKEDIYKLEDLIQKDLKSWFH